MTHGVTIAGYSVLAAAIIGCDVAGRLWRHAPTLGQAATSAMRSRAGRWLVLAGWLWLGWHLFVRSDWR